MRIKFITKLCYEFHVNYNLLIDKAFQLKITLLFDIQDVYQTVNILIDNSEKFLIEYQR